MLQIEKDFLNAIKSKNDGFVLRCLNRGLTANICDENGFTALEYALKYNGELLTTLAQHPKTTKETLGRTLDYLEAQHFFNKDIRAFEKWKKESSLIKKLFDIAVTSTAVTLSTKATSAYSSILTIRTYLLDLYEKERS